MKMFGVLAALAAATIPAHGQSSYETAMQLGSVLASEAACDLKYDQTAIQFFIEQNVKADDMDFASSLQSFISVYEYQIGEMAPSAKTAHCTQIARVAKSYDFVD